MRATALALILVAFVLLVSCLKLHIEPILPVHEELPTPATTTSVQLEISGEDVARKDFVRAVTVSRIFSSRVSNDTGSIQDLLSTAIAESFRRKSIALCKSECARKLQIRFDRFLFAWIPPREFIETPDPRYRGIVRIEFQVHTTLDGKTFPFEYTREIPTLPGEEGGILGLEVRRGLRAYVEWLMERL
ncbi:MAG: hypothetical protein K8S54_01935 [Spirochaetia bacterium]|nr:hypothetical protein [Spirochaetia bacterium]